MVVVVNADKLDHINSDFFLFVFLFFFQKFDRVHQENEIMVSHVTLRRRVLQTRGPARAELCSIKQYLQEVQTHLSRSLQGPSR